MIVKKIIRMTTVNSWDYFNMNLKILSKSSQATIDLGKKFSKILRGGDIILFSGELGGGKTTFISGLADGLGIKENLSSPSFTILNQYMEGKIRLVHIDFYRLDGVDEFDNIGIDEVWEIIEEYIELTKSNNYFDDQTPRNRKCGGSRRSIQSNYN